MAGNFILSSITQSDLDTAKAQKGITFSSTAAHNKGMPVNPDKPAGAKFAGWTHETRAELTTALAGEPIPNREKLPPHRYLEIATWKSLPKETQDYVSGAGWVENLRRPRGAGLGLKSLSTIAETDWNAGRKTAAFLETLQKGNVSIEIYYQSGYEMY